MDRFRRRAQFLFVFMAVVALLGVGIALVVPDEIPAVVRLAALGSSALSVAAYVALIRALGLGRDWSMSATVWACWLLVLAGVVQVVYELSRSTVTVPLAALLALVVLVTRPKSSVMPVLGAAARRARALVIGALVVATAGPVLFGAVLDSRSFAIGPEAIDLTMALECPSAEAPGHGVRTVGVDASWRFLKAEPFPPPTDGVVVRWDTNTGLDEAEVTLVDDHWEPVDAIWRGGSGDVLVQMTPVVEEGPNEQYGIDVAGHGQVDGHIHLRLQVPADFVGDLSAWSVYAHGKRWMTASDQAICTFGG